MFEETFILQEKPKLARLFGRFVDSLLAMDYDTATSWCDTPISIATANGVHIHRTPRDVADGLAEQWSHWQGQVTWMRPKLLDLRSYGPDLLVVDIEWFMLDTTGLGKNPVFSSYVMRRHGADYRVAHITSYNEALERPAG